MFHGTLVDLIPCPAALDDLEYVWTNDEAGFWSNAGSRPVVSRAAYHAYLERRRKREADNPNAAIRFGVQTKSGELIGRIHIHDILPPHRWGILSAQIGDPAYWGGGYGTDALLLFVQYCFDWLDLRKVWLGTLSLNARVLRQMQKVGFVQELRQRDAAYADGQWADMIVFALPREAWRGYAAEANRLGLRAPRAGEVSRSEGEVAR